MLLSRVAFSCFEKLFSCDYEQDSWLIEILSVVDYPWYVKEDGESGLRAPGSDLFPTVEIVQYCPDSVPEAECNGCGVEGKKCYQRIQFAIPGCDSLEESAKYTFENFVYDCSGDCEAVKATLGDELIVNASVILQASQDNCGQDISIDLDPSTVSVSMNSYLDDYENTNAVFIYTDNDDLNYAYFIVAVDSSVPTTAVSLVSLTSAIDGDTGNDVTDAVEKDLACSDEKQFCFRIPLDALVTPDQIKDNNLIKLTETAIIEISYQSDGGKRTIPLGNKFDVSKSIRWYGDSSSETEAETGQSSLFGVIPALSALFFLL
jgi:hypothetical protein